MLLTEKEAAFIHRTIGHTLAYFANHKPEPTLDPDIPVRLRSAQGLLGLKDDDETTDLTPQKQDPQPHAVDQSSYTYDKLPEQSNVPQPSLYPFVFVLESELSLISRSLFLVEMSHERYAIYKRNEVLLFRGPEFHNRHTFDNYAGNAAWACINSTDPDYSRFLAHHHASIAKINAGSGAPCTAPTAMPEQPPEVRTQVIGDFTYQITHGFRHQPNEPEEDDQPDTEAIEKHRVQAALQQRKQEVQRHRRSARNQLVYTSKTNFFLPSGPRGQARAADNRKIEFLAIPTSGYATLYFWAKGERPRILNLANLANECPGVTWAQVETTDPMHSYMSWRYDGPKK